MCYSILLLLLGLLILLFVTPTAQYCYQTGNYTSNSTYRANLVGLLASMSSNTKIDYGFYNFSAGENADKVNAIALCRGDIPPDFCRNYINSTSHTLLESCPNQMKAFTGDGTCTLRYSNQAIFGTLETEPPLIFYNRQNALDVEKFNQVLGQLLDRLTKHAAQGNSTRKFALDSERATDLETIYALVECTPDLDPNQCTICLKSLVEEIPRCCSGKSGGRYIAPSCDLRFETYHFYDSKLEELSPPPIVPPASTPPPQSLPPTEVFAGTKRNTTRTAVIIVVSTLVGIILVISIIYLFLRVRKHKDHFKSVDEISSADSLQFDIRTIKVATDNFSTANELGKGGFGIVYKGELPNGQEIAVKRLSKTSQQGDLEFKNEVKLVATLQHRNLVRLLGFCLEGKERLLVYEFVPNASLEKFIFDPNKSALLNWEMRH
ncbi:hypothetical protein I3760_09G080700 [Carya illinoinensis]|nr:hypothetical protein I3760_09G080700 [Carya illinoinensis]